MKRPSSEMKSSENSSSCGSINLFNIYIYIYIYIYIWDSLYIYIYIDI